MIHIILGKLRQLSKNKKLVVSCAVLAAALLVLLGVMIGANRAHDASAAAKRSPSAANSPANTSVEGSATGSSPTANSTNDKTDKNSSSATVTATGSSPSSVIRTTINSDGTTTKEIASYTSIPFSALTQNDANLKRGTSRVQPGQNGVKTTVYSVNYDKSGKEISRKMVSDAVTKQPVSQITKVGISDFNLNTDTWEGTEFGVTCLPAEFGIGGDACFGVPGTQYFSAVQISGTYYVFCVSADPNVCSMISAPNLHPVAAVHGNTFNYLGTTYQADARKGGGGPEQLSPAHCSQYGLACGRW